MEILRLEFKKQGGFKRLFKFILVSMILGVLWSYFIIGQKTEGFMMTGCYKDYKGLEAIDIASRDRREYSGKMENKNFEKAAGVYRKSLDVDGNINMSDDLLKLSVYADKLATQDYMFKKYTGKDIYTIELENGFGEDFYKREEEIYDLYINDKWTRESENRLARQIYKETSFPYEYYDGYGVWMEGVEHIQILGLIFMLIICIFNSGIISKDRESGIDKIIGTTIYGRKELYLSKVVFTMITNLIIYISGIFVYICILKYLLPLEGLNTSAQLLSYGILNQTIGEILKVTFKFGILSNFVISSFLIFISSLVQKEKTSLIISILVVILNFFLAFSLANNGSLFKYIMFFIPGNTLFLHYIMNPVISFFNIPILTYNFNIFISFISIFIFLIIGKFRYERR